MRPERKGLVCLLPQPDSLHSWTRTGTLPPENHARLGG